LTSTGIRNRRTTDEKIGDTINNANDEYIQRARKGIADSSPVTGNAGRPSASGPTTPGASTLDPAGGTMFGTLAYGPQALAISDGRVNIQANQSGASKASSYILVTAQGSPDDLNFIDGADKNGQILDFQGTLTQIINIKHADIGTISNIVGTTTVTVTTTINHNITTGQKGNILDTTNFNVQNVVFTKTGSNTFTYPATGSATPETSGTFQRGNILTSDGADIALDGTIFANAVPWVSMRFDPTVLGFGAWRVQFGAGSGTGVSFPVIPPVDVRGNVNTNQDIDLSLTTAHSTTMTLTGDIDITFSNFPTTANQIEWEIEITQDGTGGHVITWPVAVVNPPTLSTTAGLVAVVVFRTNDNGTTIRVGNTVTTGSSVSQWANFQAVNDVNFATFDGINIDRLLFDQAAGGSLAAGVTGITSDASSNMIFNIPANTIYSLRSNALSILSLDNTSADLALALFARDDEIPIFQLTRLDSTPSVGTEIGRISYVGVDSTGSTQEEFARITVDSEDLTIGSVDGSMHLQVDLASLTTAFISLNNSNDGKVSLWKNIFMQTGIDIEINGNDIIFDSTGTNLINADSAGLDLRASGSGDTIQMHSDGVIHTFSATGLQLGVTANLDLFARAARITPSTATFLSDGDISYNSVANEFRFRENGVTITLGAGGGANTQLSNLSGTVAVNVDLDPGTTNTLDMGNITFRWQEQFVQKINLSSSSGNGFTTDLVPDSDSNRTLGNATTLWLTTHTDRIRLTNANNTIFESAGVMNIAANTELQFQIGAVDAGKIVSTSEWDFENATLNGVAGIGFEDGHTLTANPSSLTMNLAANDEFVIQDVGVQFASFGSQIGSLTHVDNGTVGYLLRLGLDSTTPADTDVLGVIEFYGRDSANNFQAFGDIACGALDVTSDTEDGFMNFNVLNNAVSNRVLQISASSGNLNMGFFGSAASAKPTITGSRGGNAALASLLTALDGLGLITDSTS